MANPRLTVLLLVAGYGAVSQAQQSGWSTGQVNATMCFWEQPRVNVIRDTVFMDGGNLWWLPGMSDGSYGAVSNDNNPLGLVYTLNFSVSFDTSQNVTALMKTVSKAPNGGAANNFAPNYVDGAMLANYDEWFLYGGLLQETSAFAPPPDDQVIAYEEYQYGVNKPGFLPGLLYDQLPSGMTTYLAYGGAVSAPSENKAWYFSGMRSETWGPIFTVSGNDSLTATNLSDTLITLDMSTQRSEVWTNVTLPSSVAARANPSLVWVPVGAQGILVSLGGVTYPEWVSVDAASENAAASKADSPAFMSTIDVYDVASGNWYSQPTTGGPGALARGCAVVAPAQDASSFNIYYYGGFDGLHVSDSFSDDVWTLSLPSFMWMKVYSGTQDHARAGHQCVMPFPDQMMVIGGYTTLQGEAPTCVGDGIIQLFNLSSATWMTQYNSTQWSKYQVPSMIYEMIGGSATGGATVTTPSPSGWANASLAKVFATPYPTSRISAFYPYGTAPANQTLPTAAPSSSGSGVPKYLAPVLGVILGLVFVTSLGVCIFVWRRRKMLRKGAASESGTDENGNRIISWMRGQQQQQQQSETKGTTVTTEDTPLSPEMEYATLTPPPPVVHHEMADTQVAELMDTSPAALELQDTGLTPVEVITKHTHLGSGGTASSRAGAAGSLNNPSYYSTISQTDHASSISRYSSPPPPPQQAGGGAPDGQPESPPLGSGVGVGVGAAVASAVPGRMASSQVHSGVSAVSEHDRAHLRQLSDTSVSSVGSASDRGGVRGSGSGSPPVVLPRSIPQPESPGPLSAGSSPSSPQPVSPPTGDGYSPDGGGGNSAEDYLSARPTRGSGAASPLRRSVFQERGEDLR